MLAGDSVGAASLLSLRSFQLFCSGLRLTSVTDRPSTETRRTSTCLRRRGSNFTPTLALVTLRKGSLP